MFVIFFVKPDWLFNPINQKLVVCYHVPSLPRRKKEEEKTLSWLIRTQATTHDSDTIRDELLVFFLLFSFPVPVGSFINANSQM